MNNWKKPLIFLLILLLVFMLRWDTEASKTSNDEVLKWERDRWTGDLWMNYYTPKGSGFILSSVERFVDAEGMRKTLSDTWKMATGIVIVWLAVEGGQVS